MSIEANPDGTFSVTDTADFYAFQPKGDCPKHGEVDVFTVTGFTGSEEYARLNCCPKCYIEWIAANVTQITPRDSNTENKK